MGHLGTLISTQISEATEGAKNRAEADRKAQAVLDKWFGNDKPQKGQFADPALLFAK